VQTAETGRTNVSSSPATFDVFDPSSHTVLHSLRITRYANKLAINLTNLVNADEEYENTKSFSQPAHYCFLGFSD
jgi:hypothetical protein